MSKPMFYTTKEGRAHMAQFILDHQNTHTVRMIHQETGASIQFIENVFIELDIVPLKATDLQLKFLLENPEMPPGEQATALKVTGTYLSRLLSMKPSPRLKQIMKLEKQTA